jgi:hypothetical protein
MPSSAKTLMGLGMPGQLARRIGANVVDKSGVGTAQVGGTALSVGEYTLLTTASGQTAFVLPADAALGDEVPVYNTTSTAALVFPPTSGTINGGSADASVSLAQNKVACFKKISATNWASGLTA